MSSEIKKNIITRDTKLNHVKINTKEATQIIRLTGIYEILLNKYPEVFTVNRLTMIYRLRLFIVIFLIPTFMSFFYLFIFSSDRYESEAQFIVRASVVSTSNKTPSASTSGSSSSGSGGSLGDLSKIRSEAFVVNSYLISRDALKALVSNNNLRKLYNNPKADFINKFPKFFWRNTDEDLYQYYLSMTQAKIDEISGISIIKAVAFTPEDARSIARGLLHSAEIIVNKMNERAYSDALETANKEVQIASDQLKKAQSKLEVFRSENKFIDPTSETKTILETISKLSIELASYETELMQKEKLTPDSPSIASLKQKITNQKNAIDKLRKQIAGEENALSEKYAMYEALTLEKDIAVKSYGLAITTREETRQNPQQKRVYIQMISDPNLSDLYSYPKRYLDFMLCISIYISIYIVVKIMRKNAMAHHG